MYPQPRTIVEALASAIQARQNCQRRNNLEWFEHWTAQITDIAKDHLPSGAGIDSGSTVDLDRSTADRIVIHTSFHHMNEDGMYDGWTEHTVTVRPSFIGGLSLTVSGRNRNEIKDHLHQTFDHALTQTAPDAYQTRGTVPAVSAS